MIWVRRFFVLPVGAAFLVLLGFTLLGARVGATLYEPDFYKRHLDRQEVYVFILGDLVEAAIEELRSKPPDFFSVLLPDNPLDALNLPTPDLVRSVNGVFPADWVQEQLEGVIDQVVGYLSGDRDDLDIRVTRQRACAGGRARAEGDTRKLACPRPGAGALRGQGSGRGSSRRARLHSERVWTVRTWSRP